MTTEFLQKIYFDIIQGAYDNKKISKTWYENLVDRFANDLDELEENYIELIHALQNAEYYILLDRIAKGEQMLEEETDERKKSEYRKLLNTFEKKLDSLTPIKEVAV